MASVAIKAVCATFATILGIALVVVLTILVYREFAQSPKEYENERGTERDDDGGCAFRYLVGNGICDDESNIKSCDFDGGDCCGIAAITRFCQDCQCYDEHGNFQTTSTTTPNDDSSTTLKDCPAPWLTGNGNCDPENDNYACDYDGGDCKHQGCPMPQYIGDGECDLDNYIPECDFDGEDCKYNATQSTTKSTTTTTTVSSTATVFKASTTKSTTTTTTVSSTATAFKASDSPSTSKNPSQEYPVSSWKPTYVTDTVGTSTTTQRSIVLEGDSICDDEHNNALSNYDGGDCCSGLSSYDHCQQCSCRQKVHMDLVELYPKCPSTYLQYIGDDVCQDFVNHAECGFDLGDCCKPKVDLDCISCICWLHDFEWPDEGNRGCPDKKSIGDHICQDENNNGQCGLDGYDCCTPFSDFSYCTECRCKLPYRPENSTHIEEIVQDMLEAEYPDCPKPEYIGDMFCDDITNTEGCNYDGGDCCNPYSFFFMCHHCVCFDMPNLEVFGDGFIDDEPPKRCESKQKSRIANGICEDDVNVQECDYDGGDCCKQDSNINFCDDCLCIQPHKEIIEEWVSQCPWYPWLVGDGNCDDFLNHQGCYHDKGDCCNADASHQFCVHCQCLVPMDDHHLEVTPNCSYSHLVHDGQCDDEANIVQCGFDGGDCCGTSNYLFCNDCMCKLPDWEDVSSHIFDGIDWNQMVNESHVSPCFALEGKCYHFISSLSNHANAQTFCNVELGGVLFEPQSKEINDKIFNASVEYFGQETPIWIGIDDLNHEGFFVYSSNQTELEFENWLPGQPNNGGFGENCVDFRPYWSRAGQWMDSDCNIPHNSICQVLVNDTSSVSLLPSFNTTLAPNATTPTPTTLNTSYAITLTPLTNSNATSVTSTPLTNVTLTVGSSSPTMTTETSTAWISSTTVTTVTNTSTTATTTGSSYVMTCSEVNGFTVCN